MFPFHFLSIDEDLNFKSPTNRFHDNGPRVVANIPLFVSLPADLGRGIPWKCDVVSEGRVNVTWLKDDEVICSSFYVIAFYTEMWFLVQSKSSVSKLVNIIA